MANSPSAFFIGTSTPTLSNPISTSDSNNGISPLSDLFNPPSNGSDSSSPLDDSPATTSPFKATTTENDYDSKWPNFPFADLSSVPATLEDLLLAESLISPSPAGFRNPDLQLVPFSSNLGDISLPYGVTSKWAMHPDRIYPSYLPSPMVMNQPSNPIKSSACGGGFRLPKPAVLASYAAFASKTFFRNLPVIHLPSFQMPSAGLHGKLVHL